jgi:SAM-dependent methyltransferase
MRLAPGSRARGSYGVDAPYLLVAPAFVVIGAIAQGLLTDSPWPFVGAALVAACTAFGLYASRRGKFVVWTRLLRELNLGGDERVLDLGCGRGAVLLLAARRLTTGRAVGVDLWRGGDQSGNAIGATQRNAALEGVSERVELHTADLTALPFADESFDLVVSNLAIHNVKSAAGRDRAIDEATRVLRSGGRLLIADLWATERYRARLVAKGMRDVRQRNLGWRMWWSGPWLSTRLANATKP